MPKTRISRLRFGQERSGTELLHPLLEGLIARLQLLDALERSTRGAVRLGMSCCRRPAATRAGYPPTDDADSA